MKTKNNAQKSGLRGLVVIIGLVLIAYAVGAQNIVGNVFFSNASEGLMMASSSSATSVGKMTEAIGNGSERNIRPNFSFASIESELEHQVPVYDANSITETEISAENTNNSEMESEINFDAIELSLDLQVEVYNPAKYVEAEMTAGEVSNMESNDTADLSAIELSLEHQVVAYDAHLYVEAEMAAERIQAEKEFFENAAVETALTADGQIEKYVNLLLEYSNESAK